MNVLELLHEDHSKVADLLAQAGRTDKAGDAEHLFQQIRREVEIHARAEEGIFYPQLQRIGPKAGEAVAKAIAQHGEAIALIGEMAKLDAASTAFRSKLDTLAKAIEAHVNHEEKVMFKFAREDLSGDLERLGGLVKHREEALKAGGQAAGSE